MAKTGILPTVRTLSMTKGVLLLLSNSAFSENCDTQRRLDALLHGYGLQMVFMPKDGNCLFSAIAFALQNLLNLQNEAASTLSEHLKSIGITSDVNMEGMITTLRKLTVDEFLGEHRNEYASYLEVNKNRMAKSFTESGFLDHALGNAVPLALSNVLKLPIVWWPIRAIVFSYLSWFFFHYLLFKVFLQK